MNYGDHEEKIKRKKRLGINFALILILTLTLTLTLTLFKAQGAIDPPHYDTGTTSPFYCSDCHKERTESDVPGLCMSCHNPAGRAKAKPFARTDQSTMGQGVVGEDTKGTTHRFDSEGLKYVKLWKPNNSTGKIKIAGGSMYSGDFSTQNEMEYEFEIVNPGDVGAATFKYRCRTRSKPQPTSSTNPFNTPVWDRDAEWSGWTSAYTTAASVSLNDSICGGDKGISLSFENGSGSPNSFDAGTGGRVYVKLLNQPSNDNMKLRVMNNKINCSVCHNQHSMQLDRPYLRAGNVGNALCKHCHDDRDRSHYMQEMGTADDGTGDSSNQTTLQLVDISKNWTVNQWVGKQVYFQKNFRGVQAAVDNEEKNLTGTLTFTQGSATVTGVGTLFSTEISSLQFIRLSSSSKWYPVTSIGTNTSLTLSIPFEEATVTGNAMTSSFAGFYRKITSNTSNTLVLDGALNAKIDNGLRYRIVDTNNYGSHPVGIKYSQMDFDTRFNSDIKPLPLDDNGTPSDTSDDTVQCMTCHSPHFTHSVGTEGGAATSGTTTSLTDTTKSWTANSLVGYELRIRNEWTSGTSNQNPNWRKRRFITSNTANKVEWLDPLTIRSNPNDSSVMIDSPPSAGDVYEIVNTSGTNLTNGIGDGYILRKPNGYSNGYIRKYQNIDDDKVICKTCHKYKNHFGDETAGGYARSCMDCHTPHNTTNRFLLREVINNREVRIRPGDNYVNSSRTGVCQVCHTQTKHWRNDGSEPQAHYAEGCPQCHQHDSEERSWIYICKTCHGYPPVPKGTIVDKKGNIHTNINDSICTNTSDPNYAGPCAEYNTFNQNIPHSSYRIEDYDGGGGAHLVHVVGALQQFECKICHGHMGYGNEHGGSVGRKTPDRNNITFNFQLDYSFNERLETKLGYQTIDPPVYPKMMGVEVGTSATYMNRADATNGYGPGKKHIGSGATSNGGNNEDATTPSILGRAVTSSDPPECYVGCHNPRRLYMQTEPESDMVDTVGSGRVDPIENAQREADPTYGDSGYGNKFNWTWYFNSSGVQGGAGGLPRDENPDVPCAKCHDAQGTLVQGNEDSPSKYKGVNYISAHPPDPTKRTDCLVCHDYNNSTKPHKKGTPYLNNKDGGASIEFDITNPSSLEPFCLSCHDSNGATDGNTATGNPKRPFSKETDVSNEVPDIKVRWTGAAHSANISCFGDGVSNGCHGNPHGSGKRALLAPYSESVGEDQKYFCFNCHGNNRDRLVLAPNIQDQIEKRSVIYGSDGNQYRCILSHTSAASNKPITGASWATYWVATGVATSSDNWVSGKNYTGGSGHPIPAAGEPWLHKRKESIIVSNRHSECIDCHDPMGDRSTHRLHSRRYVDIDGNPWNPNKDSVASTHPMWGGDSTTNYVRQPYVYEVCFRCHGPNYGTFFKDYMPFPQVAKDRVGMDGHFSDKRKEFDPRSNQFADYPASGNLGANTAYHPVAAPGRNATDPLYRQLQAAFDLTSANDLKSLTIQCPDCHNNNVLGTASTGLRGPVTYSNRRLTDKTPAVVNTPNTFSNTDNRQDDKRIGPHGSTNRRILRAPYNTNVNYTRTSRGAYNTIKTASFSLCFLCHKENVLLAINAGFQGTNFGGTGNGWWTANLHAEHLSSETGTEIFSSDTVTGYSGSEGGQAVCHECHHNVHSNVEAQNTIYGDGLGGMLPPDSEDGILDGVSSTHLLNFAPSVQGATALKPRWYYDGEYYRCDMYCHGANMNYCWYKHGQAGSISQWCEDD
ncbi:MAG: hypothetical protein HZA00_07940 [Nitrospinae bacterium]|nr:hypothetical protein [Nitrospinota bacterium]